MQIKRRLYQKQMSIVIQKLFFFGNHTYQTQTSLQTVLAPHCFHFHKKKCKNRSANLRFFINYHHLFKLSLQKQLQTISFELFAHYILLGNLSREKFIKLQKITMIFVKQKFAGCEWQLKNSSQMMSFSAKNGRIAHISSDVMPI